jgi:hypothetical protein
VLLKAIKQSTQPKILKEVLALARQEKGLSQEE